jgi:uncharacterized protein (TIRG00374 family)
VARINSKTLIKLSFFAAGFLFLYFLINRVGLNKIIDTVSQAKPGFLLAGVAVYLILISLRAFKWFLLIRSAGSKAGFWEFLPIYLTNCLTGNITPFKSGEAATPFLLKKYLNFPVGQGFSVVILDRFFELATFALLFCFGVFYIINSSILENSAILTFKIALAVLFLIIAVLLTAIISQKAVTKIFNFFGRLKKYALLKKILDFAEKEIKIFYEGMTLFKNKRAYKFLIPLTFLCWLLEFLSFYFVIRSVLAASFFDVAAAQLAAIAGALITFIPLGIGVSELGAVFCLGLFGYPVLLATSGLILVRIFLTGTLLTSGALGTLWIKEKK